MSSTPAGWYPDPEQALTQRYWDGKEWTDQRAPLPPPTPKATMDISPRLVLGFLGAIAAGAGVFLPRVDSPTSLHIAENSVIATDVVVGGLVLAFAVTGAISAYQARAEEDRHVWLVLAGLLVLGAAIYYGTGDRLTLHTVSVEFFSGGATFQGSPGVGIYAMGAGGVLLALAGLARSNGPGERTQVQ